MSKQDGVPQLSHEALNIITLFARDIILWAFQSLTSTEWYMQEIIIGADAANTMASKSSFNQFIRLHYISKNYLIY